MGQPYNKELDAFADTYCWTAKQNVSTLKLFLDRWSTSHTVVVGSGGSYSAATAISLFRELAHHTATTPVTPLGFMSLIERMTPQVLLLSAEGKNKDILAAARAAISADLRSAAITLTYPNPLTELCESSNAIRAFSFQMDWVKDGYLATNSLLATVLLAYRAFFGDEAFEKLKNTFSPQRLHERRAGFSSFKCNAAAQQKSLLVLYSEEARVFAVDLESRLSESALAMVQIADLRQFAHGRHLQLADKDRAPYVIFVSSAKDVALVDATASQLPEWIPSFKISLLGETLSENIVHGLVDAMFLTEAIAAGVSYDPGQPEVPQFGREIHSIDPGSYVRNVDSSIVHLAAKRKAQPVPGGNISTAVSLAAEVYLNRLTDAKIHAVVCDFDGTLCRTEDRFSGLSSQIIQQIEELTQQGLRFAIATGRGDSLHKVLLESFAHCHHGSILVGYYSGSYIADLGEPFERPPMNVEFEDLYQWLRNSVFHQLCSKKLDELARGGQFTIRTANSQQSRRMRVAIRAWLDKTGRTSWKVYSSGHSVDILDGDTSKLSVVRRLASDFGLDVNSEILRIGDCGQEDGNDYDLLSEGLSLSCDGVSASLDSCWNYAPHGANQANCVMTYLSALKKENSHFRVSRQALINFGI